MWKWLVGGVLVVGGVGALVMFNAPAKQEDPKAKGQAAGGGVDVMAQFQAFQGQVMGIANQTFSDPSTQKNLAEGAQGLIGFGANFIKGLG